MMATAIRRCVQEVITLERTCMDAELAGQACDVDLRDQGIAAAKLTARRVVTTDCTGGQLTELQFLNEDDARTDISRTCTNQPAAVMSIAYPPAAQESAAALDELERECVVQVSAYSRSLLRYIVREKTLVLDLMAAHPIGKAKKTALLKRAADRITRARAKLVQRIAAACPHFEAMYGQSPTDVLTGLTPVGNCVVGAAYVQTAIACPLCGNGVTDSSEQCDDGNRIDTDLCHNDCTKAQ